MSARKSNYKSSKVKDNFGDEESPPSPPSNIEQNPFSFKQFISNPTKELTPELPLNSKATKIKPIATPIPVELTDALADALADQTIKKSNEKNPFSFKHFISSSEPTVAIPPPPPQSTLVCDVSFSPPTPSANFLPSPPDFITAPEHLIDNCQALPDFINESLLKKSDESTITNNQIPSYFDLETNLNEVQTPDETIKVLKKALKEKQQTINEQSDRISQLEKSIVNLKQNEANENKALEDMIQHVEENLVKTTKRAVESERSADKMKQDIKQLKTQVSLLQAENVLLKKNSTQDNSDTESKSLSEYASQLHGAAATAELQLKQLLKGCDSLRLVASSLESYGKIKQMNEPNNNKQTK